MITQQTTFIIGAGASAELGLPLGHELKTRIRDELIEFWEPYEEAADAFRGLHRLATYFKSATSEFLPAELKHASEKLIESLPSVDSIDDFLAIFKEDICVSLLAKGMIHLHIREASRKAFSGPYDQDYAWISRFWRLASNDAQTIEELQEGFKQIKIINFNYDLTFEFGILKHICQKFNVPQHRAIQTAKSLKILHPYGSVSSSSASGWDAVRDLLRPIESNECLDRHTNIRTIHEGAWEQEENSIGEMLSQAERMIFLGFGFHRYNMKLLSFASNEVHNWTISEILFSHFGLSDYNANFIEKELTEYFVRENRNGGVSFNQPSIHGRGDTASEFLNNISYSFR